MLQEIPKHKGTDHLQADLKAKMAKVKREMASEKGAGKKKGHGLRIPAARGGHGDPAGRSERRQEPTDRQPHPRHPRGRPVSVHHPDARARA